MQPGQRVYHLGTLMLGTLKSQPTVPDSGGTFLVADVRWDDGTVTCVPAHRLRRDCTICAGGCECTSTGCGCTHFACWGAQDDAQATCHAVPAHRAALEAAAAARKAAAERRPPVPIYA